MTNEEKCDALKHMISSRGWQDVFKPALKRAIDNAVDQLVLGTRPKDDTATDEELKLRVRHLRWVLEWETRTADLVKQLEAVMEVERNTESAAPSGTPY